MDFNPKQEMIKALEALDEQLFKPAIERFEALIKDSAEKGESSAEMAIDPKVCVRLSQIENSIFLKEKVKEFKDAGVSLTFVRDDYESGFFIKEDHKFVAEW